MAKDIYKITEQFEQALCDYTGAPFAVALDNGSSAIFLSLVYDNIQGQTISIPKHTYPSVPCEIIHAGGKVAFYDSDPILVGAYQIGFTRAMDSALRFTADMYKKGFFMCLSFTGPYKHLKLSKGGAILTDDKTAYEWFKRSRFSGRKECSYHDDSLDMTGWNFYMMPEIATRGILLMKQFYNMDGTKKDMPDLELPYPDLSKSKAYGK